MDSIHGRLLGAVTFTLMAFLGLTGWALDQAFRESARSAVRDRLQAHVYGLLAAADLGSDAALLMPDGLPEPRFSTPGSGIYAEVSDTQDRIVWRSPSMLGLDARFRVPPRAGAFLFHRLAVGGAPHFGISFRVVWERESGEESVLVFGVAESTEAFDRTIAGFRRSLWGWLGGLAAVLLLLQWAIMRWGLAPLRHVAEDLRSIESGECERLEGQYPLEIRRLTDNLNALIARDKARLERYRNAMGDLAHSLKTPLAVIQGIAHKGREPSSDAVQLGEQARRMNQIVEYQLQRASTSGRAALASVVQPQPLLEKLLATLSKVYADKAVQVTVDISEQTVFHGESGDLMELAGNLLDNAFKCCRRRIAVRLRQMPESEQQPAATTQGLDLRVDDDGPGIPDGLREAVLQRGVRADEAAHGQGIGLAVVREIVEAYEGRLEIGSSELGGAQIRVTLPGG